MTKLLFAGGIFNIAFALFHLFFWKLFDWKNDLKNIRFINRNIIQILNVCLTFVFIVFGYLSMIHTEEMLHSPIGISVTFCIGLFWFLRALMQIAFFKLCTPASWGLFILFIIGTLLYGVPLFSVVHS